MDESIMHQEMTKWLNPECINILDGSGDTRIKAASFMQCMTDSSLIERVFGKPSKDTFIIKPISELLKQEVNTEDLWIDPFAGYNSPARVTNDINPGVDTTYHLDALDFLKLFSDNSVDGVLYDPPYSSYQAEHSYGLIKTGMFGYAAAGKHAQLKDEMARIIKPGGKAICFGWSTMGLTKSRGFKMNRILIVRHGGSHNDTLVTVETKMQKE